MSSQSHIAALQCWCSGDGWPYACTRDSLITLILNKIWALLNTHLRNSVVHLYIFLTAFERNRFIMTVERFIMPD